MLGWANMNSPSCVFLPSPWSIASTAFCSAACVAGVLFPSSASSSSHFAAFLLIFFSIFSSRSFSFLSFFSCFLLFLSFLPAAVDVNRLLSSSSSVCLPSASSLLLGADMIVGGFTAQALSAFSFSCFCGCFSSSFRSSTFSTFLSCCSSFCGSSSFSFSSGSFFCFCCCSFFSCSSSASSSSHFAAFLLIFFSIFSSRSFSFLSFFSCFLLFLSFLPAAVDVNRLLSSSSSVCSPSASSLLLGADMIVGGFTAQALSAFSFSCFCGCFSSSFRSSTFSTFLSCCSSFCGSSSFSFSSGSFFCFCCCSFFSCSSSASSSSHFAAFLLIFFSIFSSRSFSFLSFFSCFLLFLSFLPAAVDVNRPLSSSSSVCSPPASSLLLGADMVVGGFTAQALSAFSFSSFCGCFSSSFTSSSFLS
ncbi:hypothetical protein Vafri_6462 [Volvox africanus]|uniref:Uncharacterized protein n=1 Tax=Volvox africanus TaxID=51714 RepID=A0A8J4B2U1_9CHLO|nr:hypothetical protein Vafri_6462 [Volvox africanus]